MMKGKSLLVLLTVVAATTSVIAVELDVSLSADVFDKYVWRGQDLGRSGVIQPSATIGKNGYSFNVWGNMPMTSVSNNSGEYSKPWAFNELDYTFDYSGSAGIYSYSLGYIVYDFPRSVGGTTQELYGRFGVDTFLSPSLTVYKGTYGTHGFYILGSAGYRIAMTEKLSVDLGASLAWGDNEYNKVFGTPAGLNDLVLSAALPIDVGGVTLVPSVKYISMVDSKIRSATAHSETWVAGIGASIEF